MDAETRDRLAAIGDTPDDAFPLFEAALWLARARRPDLNPAPYRRHLDRLTEEVRAHADEARPSTEAMREALVQVLARRYGYGGNEAAFEDLDAADIARVVDRRIGLPVALGILYIEVCARLGWPLSGIDFPGRFVVRLGAGPDTRLIDLFDGPRDLDAPALRGVLKAVAGPQAELEPRHLEVMTPRRVVLRLEDNIRVRQMQRGQLAAAADTLEAMLLVAPGAGHLWREAAMVNARLDRIQTAVAQLEEFLRRAPGGDGGYQTSLLLQELRARLN